MFTFLLCCFTFISTVGGLAEAIVGNPISLPIKIPNFFSNNFIVRSPFSAEIVMKLRFTAFVGWKLENDLNRFIWRCFRLPLLLLRQNKLIHSRATTTWWQWNYAEKCDLIDWWIFNFAIMLGRPLIMLWDAVQWVAKVWWLIIRALSFFSPHWKRNTKALEI